MRVNGEWVICEDQELRPIVRGKVRLSNDRWADLSVLGRDVTNNFSVIYDYPNQTVALLAPLHHYEIKSSPPTAP